MSQFSWGGVPHNQFQQQEQSAGEFQQHRKRKLNCLEDEDSEDASAKKDPFVEKDNFTSSTNSQHLGNVEPGDDLLGDLSLVKEEELEIDITNEDLKDSSHDETSFVLDKKTPQLVCQICNKTFKTRSKQTLYTHYVQHFRSELEYLNGADGGLLRCSFCGKSQGSGDKLAVHVGVAHGKLEDVLPDSMKYSCLLGAAGADCTELEDKVKALLQKLYLPEDKGVSVSSCFSRNPESGCFLDCQVCEKLVLGKQWEVKRHLIMHYQEEVLRRCLTGLTCHFCNARYDKKLRLAFHVAITHDIFEEVIPEDKRLIRNVSDVLVENVDPKVKILLDKLGLPQDKEIHVYTREKQRCYVDCRQCDKLILGSAYSLKRHLMKHYQDQILDKCPQDLSCHSCNKTFQLRSEQTWHFGIAHRIFEEVIPREERAIREVSDVLNNGGGECGLGGDELSPKVRCLVEKLGWSAEQGIKVYGKGEKKHCAFTFCDNCQMLIVGQTVTLKKHIIGHFKAQLLKEFSSPSSERKKCDTCHKIKYPSELAIHYGLEHGLADTIIPKEHFEVTLITDFLRGGKEGGKKAKGVRRGGHAALPGSPQSDDGAVKIRFPLTRSGKRLRESNNGESHSASVSENADEVELKFDVSSTEDKSVDDTASSDANDRSEAKRDVGDENG